MPTTCAPICQDSKECDARFGVGVLLEAPARVRIVDVDPDGEQLIAERDLPDPPACHPCIFDMPGGRLELRVDVVERSAYLGPYSGSVGVPPPAATPPVAGGVPSTGMTAADIASALTGLRDRDHCVGSDRVFPSGTMLLRGRALLLGEKFDRYYQLGAFAAAIPDPRVQQMVLQQIRASLGDDQYDNLFVPLIWSDVLAALHAVRTVAHGFRVDVVERESVGIAIASSGAVGLGSFLTMNSFTHQFASTPGSLRPIPPSVM